MWDRVARNFDCDFVLLLPMEWWIDRDITFNHTNRLFPDYLHARLIVDDSRLHLVSPVGDTAVQRLQYYVRAIPYWHYLHYDRNPLSFLDAMLPEGRRIPNPFYYDSRAPEVETADIYRRVIQSIASDGPQVNVLFRGSNRKLLPLLMPSEPKGIGAASVKELSGFLYLAPAGHKSSWGNELMAHAFFHILTGREPSPAQKIYSKDIIAKTSGRPRPLHNYQHIWLSYRTGERSAAFVAAENRHMGVAELHVTHMHQHGISALLALVNPDTGIADSCMIPLQNIPEDGARLILNSSLPRNHSTTFGTLEQIQPDIAIYRVQVPNIHDDRCKVVLTDNNSPIRKGTLMLGEESIAVIYNSTLKASHGPLISLRELGEHQASTGQAWEMDNLAIHLKAENTAILQRPFSELLSTPMPDFYTLEQPPSKLIVEKSRNSKVVAQ